MDIKHVLVDESAATRVPRRRSRRARRRAPLRWREHPGGLVEIGHDGAGFAFDNESPRHRVYLEPYAIANATVSCGDWLAFIDDGGYHRPELWLSDGWAIVQAQQLGSAAVLGTRRDRLAGVHALRHARPSTRARRSATSATTRPTRSRTGRRRGCRPKPSGRRPRPSGRGVVSATCGSGPRPRTCRIRASGPRRARSVSTTASSWSTSTCCAAVAARRRKAMCARRTATSSRREPDGRSAAPDSRATRSRDAPDREGPDGRTNASRSTSTFRPITGAPRWPRTPRPGSPRRRRRCRRCGSTTSTEASCSTRSPGCPSTTRPAPSARSSPRTRRRSSNRATRDVLVELGSGTSDKTRLLLDAMADAGTLAALRPVRRERGDAAARGGRRSPTTYDVPVHAIVGDFHRHLGTIPRGERRLVAFLGSTIGNLDARAAPAVLLRPRRDARLRRLAAARHRPRQGSRPGSSPPTTTRPGVTAAFNRNVLGVLNRELGAHFDLDAFDHVARWNDDRRVGSRCGCDRATSNSSRSTISR